MNEKLFIKYTLEDGAYAPEFAHNTDAGADLRSRENMVIPPHSRAFFDTGVRMEIPMGWYGSIRSKSGLYRNKGITTTGVVDCGYRGTIGVTLSNNSEFACMISNGDKIAQILFEPVACGGDVEFRNVNSLTESDRGEGGFGSTGK